MKFSEKIVRLRKTKGMTQEELAEAVGVSRQAVYKWECGQSYPEVAKLLELKLLFSISIDDLLDENFEVAAPEKKRRKRMHKEVTEQNTEAMPESAEPENNAADTAENVETVNEAIQEAPAKTMTEEKVEKADELNKESLPAADTEEPAKTEKKRGFFARLFGRK